jgi:ACS family hexuronate transporter-like MFS transporter
VVWLYASFGSWRPAFLITGTLGLLWIVLWAWLYHPPESHPRISERERRMILESREAEHVEDSPAACAGWRHLLAMRETWGIILGRGLTDPVWFFVTDWFAIYLVSKGFAVSDSLMGFWVPFLAADAGNFAGGGLSSWLVRRGWSPVRARKFVIVVCGAGMTLLAAAVFVSSLPMLAAFFGISTFCYAAWSTMALALPTDLFPSRSVASVSGMGGTGAGVGTIVSTWLIGWSADRYSFEPVLIAASFIPLLATGLVLALVRERRTA